MSFNVRYPPSSRMATVAGGIPVIKTLREGLAGNRAQRVYGRVLTGKGLVYGGSRARTEAGDAANSRLDAVASFAVVEV